MSHRSILRLTRHAGLPAAVLLLWLTAVALPAATVVETANEFLLTGRFGAGEVAVIDKANGALRIGAASPDGGLLWRDVIRTGVSNPTSVAAGYLTDNAREAFVLLPDANGGAVLVFGDGEQGRLPLPADRNRLTAAYTSGGGSPSASDDALVILGADPTTGDPRLRLLQITNRLASLRADLPLDVELRELRRVDADRVAALAPAGPGEVELRLFTLGMDTARVVDHLPQLPADTRWILGRIEDSRALTVLAWQPGAPILRVGTQTVSGGDSPRFGPPALFDLGFPIAMVFPLDAADGRMRCAVVSAGGDTAAIYDWDGVGLLPVQSLAARSGRRWTALLPDGTGHLLAFAAASTGTASTQWQRWLATPAGYVAGPAGPLPAINPRRAGGNVLLFDADPLATEDARLLATLNLPDWTADPTGLPAALEVAVAALTPTNGLGAPVRRLVAPLPTGTRVALVNQLAPDIAMVNFAPADATSPAALDLVVEPPGGDPIEGEPISLHVVVRNRGGDASQPAQLEWNVPAGLDLVAASASAGLVNTNGGRVRLDLAALATGAEVRLELTVRGPPGAVREPFVLRAAIDPGTVLQTAPLPGVWIVPRPLGPGSAWSGEGNLLDSLSTNHAIARGNVRFGAGIRGQAFELDGATSLELSDNPLLRPDATAFTVAAWVRFADPPGTAQPQFVFAAPATFAGYDSFGLVHDGTQLVLRLTSAGGYTSSQGAPWLPAPATWYHLAATYDGAELRVYVDGVLFVRERTPAWFGPLAYPQPARGHWGGDGRGHFLHGTLDELRLVDHALDEAAIRALAGRDEPVALPRPVSGTVVVQRPDQSIWLQPPSGSAPTFVTFGQGPRLSPDGRHLLLYRDVKAAHAASGGSLIELDLQTGAESPRLDDAFETRGWCWTPDGRGWLYAQYLRGGIRRVDRATGADVLLVGEGGQQSFPTVNPVDGRVAFSGALAGSDAWLHVVDANGGGLTHVPNTTPRDAHPSWSPDGSWLAIHDGDGWFKLRPDGTQRTRLSPATATRRPTAAPAIWSADGQWLFASLLDEFTSLGRAYRIATDGSLRLDPLPGTTPANAAALGGLFDEPPGGVADLTLNTAASIRTAVRGTPFEIDLTVANRGPAVATGITVTAEWSAGSREFSVIAGTASAELHGSNLVLRLPDLASGQSNRMRLSCTPRVTGAWTQNFRLEATTPESNAIDNDARLDLIVLPEITVDAPIAYGRADGTIWLLSGAAEDQMLTPGWRPSISPDGRWLLFETVASTANHIEVAVLDVTPLAAGLPPGPPQSLGWFPARVTHSLAWFDAGERIAFASLDAAGRPTRTLLWRDPDLAGAPPTPAAWSVGAASAPVTGRIASPFLDVATPSGHRLAAFDRAQEPSWSPDGRVLAMRGAFEFVLLSAPLGRPAGDPVWLTQTIERHCRVPVNPCPPGDEIERLAPGGVQFEGPGAWTRDGKYLVAIGRPIGPDGVAGEPGLFAVRTVPGGGIRPLPIQTGAAPVSVGSAGTVLALLEPGALHIEPDGRRTLDLVLPADDPRLRLEALPALGSDAWRAVILPLVRDGHERPLRLDLDSIGPAAFLRLYVHE